MRFNLIKFVVFLAIPLILGGCSGGDSTRVTTASTRVEIPDGFIESSDESYLQGGWEKVLVSEEEASHKMLRLTSDLGRAPAADTTFSTLLGESLSGDAYGADFDIVKRSDISIENADRALEVEFRYTTDTGVECTGYWWLFSSTATGTTAAVELSGADLAGAEVSDVKKSIEYRP